MTPGATISAGLIRGIDRVTATELSFFMAIPALTAAGHRVTLQATRCLSEDVFLTLGLTDDQVHSPNEKFDLTCFRHGARSHARLLGRLAGG